MTTPPVNTPREAAPLAAGQENYWNAIAGSLLKTEADSLWRAHSDAVNDALLCDWLPAKPVERMLKTDLFDEALGDGLYPLLATRAAHVVGVDLAAVFLQTAARRHPALSVTGADVRRLPFQDGAFEVVVSNSTLDHFESLGEVAASLRELHRVLRPGGELLLTMDNPVNPLVALRNAAPAGLLQRLGLVPYFVGATCGPGRLKRMLAETGFEALETAALMHCPRVLAVAMARRIHRRGSAEGRARFLRFLMRLECLSKWPTRFLTGHFVGVRARRL